jgi:predicted nucleic acid-binding protein
LPVCNFVIENAISLKQQRKMSLGDSLIAATALVNNDKLTNNVEDFIGISGLSVISLKSVF